MLASIPQACPSSSLYTRKLDSVYLQGSSQLLQLPKDAVEAFISLRHATAPTYLHLRDATPPCLNGPTATAYSILCLLCTSQMRICVSAPMTP